MSKIVFLYGYILLLLFFEIKFIIEALHYNLITGMDTIVCNVFLGRTEYWRGVCV